VCGISAPANARTAETRRVCERMIARVLLLCFFCTLACSTYWSWSAIRSAVDAQLESDAETSVLSLDWSSVALLRTVARENALPVVVFYCSLYIVKQTLSLPGSAVLNLIAGALFGAVRSFLMISVLTTVGSSCCFLLSHLIFASFFRRYFADRIVSVRQSVKENRDDLLWWLLSARLTPASPNWLLNMVSPLVGVPLHLHAVSVFVGLAPYHYMCAILGSSIATAADADAAALFDVKSVALLLSAAIAALLPVAMRRLKQRRSQTSTSATPPSSPSSAATASSYVGPVTRSRSPGRTPKRV
jgi:uncharacterized membrane protein YdjX (TVP38/TMEM64 family)